MKFDGASVRDLYALPPTLTVEQTADLLSIGRSAAYDAVKMGQLPSLRIGRKLRVPTARLLEMLGVSALTTEAIATETTKARPIARAPRPEDTS